MPSLTITKRDITPPHMRAANLAPSLKQRVSNLRGGIRTRFLGIFPCIQGIPCEFQPGCCKKRNVLTAPTINLDLEPEACEVLHFILPVTSQSTVKSRYTGRTYVGTFAVEGILRTRLINSSTQGSETTITECECSGGDRSTTKMIQGSATLRGTKDEALRALTADFEGMGTSFAPYKDIHPSKHQLLRAVFYREDFLIRRGLFGFRTDDRLIQMMNEARQGFVRVDDIARVEIGWDWQGKANNKVTEFHAQGSLPVENAVKSTNSIYNHYPLGQDPPGFRRYPNPGWEEDWAKLHQP